MLGPTLPVVLAALPSVVAFGVIVAWLAGFVRARAIAPVTATPRPIQRAVPAQVSAPIVAPPVVAPAPKIPRAAKPPVSNGTDQLDALIGGLAPARGSQKSRVSGGTDQLDALIGDLPFAQGSTKSPAVPLADEPVVPLNQFVDNNPTTVTKPEPSNEDDVAFDAAFDALRLE